MTVKGKESKRLIQMHLFSLVLKSHCSEYLFLNDFIQAYGLVHW